MIEILSVILLVIIQFVYQMHVNTISLKFETTFLMRDLNYLSLT